MITKLPPWFKQEIPQVGALSKMRLLSESTVNTVCRQARCPNQGDCFDKSQLTFMILGEKCTRNCSFCAVESVNGKPLPLDLEEPFRVAEVVKNLGLSYVVITSVTRDDLEDAGAEIFARTVSLIRELNEGIKIELLIPDFSGKISCLKKIIDSGTTVVGHNIETVKRLYKQIRPQADYKMSLDVLKKLKELAPTLFTKSSMMLGMGEGRKEVIEAMKDLRSVNCDIFTLGQYLAPSTENYPVKEFVGLGQFEEYRRIGIELGFKAVLSGPLVRSSYRAYEVYKQVTNE